MTMTQRLCHKALGVIAGMLLAACAADDSGITPAVTPESKGRMVHLSMSVNVPDAVATDEGSRAAVTTPDEDNYFEREDSRYEKIYTLRVIIVRQELNIVEHNRMFVFGTDGVVRYDDLSFEVVGGEKKKIYLFANEAMVPYDFSTIKAGAEFPTAEVEGITIPATSGVLADNTGDTRTYLPMSEAWSDIEVRLPHKPEDYFQTLSPLFITRTAVKFTFNISGAPEDAGMYVKNITFSSLADKEYLLPRNTVYSPAKGQPAIKNPSAGVPDPDITGRFITSYEVPSDVTHAPYTFTPTKEIAVTEKGATLYPSLYFCESLFNFAGENGMPYKVSVTVVTRNGQTSEIEAELDATPLDNLPILPRNTHVKVNINIRENTGTVELKPYTGVYLDPDFGIDRKQTT